MTDLNEITRKADITARLGVHAALIAGLQQHAHAAASLDDLYVRHLFRTHQEAYCPALGPPSGYALRLLRQLERSYVVSKKS